MIRKLLTANLLYQDYKMIPWAGGIFELKGYYENENMSRSQKERPGTLLPRPWPMGEAENQSDLWVSDPRGFLERQGEQNDSQAHKSSATEPREILRVEMRGGPLWELTVWTPDQLE